MKRSVADAAPPNLRDQRAISRLLIAVVAIGFVALIAIVAGAAWVNHSTHQHTGWVVHTYQVEREVADLTTALERSESGRRAYMLAGRPAARLVAVRNGAELRPRIDAIARLTADNPRQIIRIANVRALNVTLARLRNRSLVLTDGGDRVRAVAEFAADASGPTIRKLRLSLAEMRAEERNLLQGRTDKLNASVREFYVLLVVVGVLLLGVALATLATVLRYTRQLSRSENDFRRLNETLEDQVVERTADLARANEEIQRFAYIVSHDLRSPLVNVMGFTAELERSAPAIAELLARAEAVAPHIVTEEARWATREDLPEAIGFIRTSTAKMDRLINAILQLSREGRRRITPEPIDAAALIAGIRDSMQHRLEQTGGAIVVEGTLPDLVSDRLAIEQLFANVIENAVKYRHPERPPRVVVRARVEGSRAVFEIADNGRGIDPRDHQRVFDLFRRSGAQDQPGEGIGLAHVRALTYRLGGTIDVASALGTGATFRITLPVQFAETTGSPQ